MHLCLAKIKGDLIFFTPNQNLGEKNIGGAFEGQTYIPLQYVNFYASYVLLFKKKALRNICMYF